MLVAPSPPPNGGGVVWLLCANRQAGFQIVIPPRATVCLRVMPRKRRVCAQQGCIRPVPQGDATTALLAAGWRQIRQLHTHRHTPLALRRLLEAGKRASFPAADQRYCDQQRRPGWDFVFHNPRSPVLALPYRPQPRRSAAQIVSQLRQPPPVAA